MRCIFVENSLSLHPFFSCYLLPISTYKTSTEHPQTSQSAVTNLTSAQENHLLPALSFSTVLLLVVCGLPLYHLPSGVQQRAVSSFLRTCPMNFHFLYLLSWLKGFMSGLSCNFDAVILFKEFSSSCYNGKHQSPFFQHPSSSFPFFHILDAFKYWYNSECLIKHQIP